MIDEKKDLTPEFLAAADVEADTPITINPVVSNELDQKKGEFRADGKHPNPSVDYDRPAGSHASVMTESVREILRKQAEEEDRLWSLTDPTGENIDALREMYCLPPLSAEDMAELVRRNRERSAGIASSELQAGDK